MGKEVKGSVECLDTKKVMFYAEGETEPTDIRTMQPLEKIEHGARICYNSEEKAKLGKAEAFLRGQILSKGHESVIEHEGVAFRVAKADIHDMTYLLGSWPSTPLMQFSFKEIPWDSAHYEMVMSGNFRTFRDFFKFTQATERTQGKCRLARSAMSYLVKHVPLMGYGIEGIPEEPDLPLEMFQPLGYQSYIALNSDWHLGKIKAGTPQEELDYLRMKHGTLTFRIDGVSRALTHQLVRHRPVAYSQRSQRYCGESTFDFIVPPSISALDQPVAGFGDNPSAFFQKDMDQAADHYVRWQELGAKNEDARFVLPNACETNIVVTTTLNQWLHMCKLRTSKHAQWEIRGVIRQIAEQITEITKLPAFGELVFED